MIRSKFLFLILFACVVVELSNATYCHEHCNLHGHCIYEGGICACYKFWNGGAPDCSYRKLLDGPLCRKPYMFYISLGSCPSGNSWTGKAVEVDTAHTLATCSNAGICNNTNGICRCFPGFAGDACEFSKLNGL